MKQYPKPMEGKEYGFEQPDKGITGGSADDSQTIERMPTPEKQEMAPEQPTQEFRELEPAPSVSISQNDAGVTAADDLSADEAYSESHRVHLLVNMAMQEGVEKAVESARHLFNKGQISSHGLDQFHDTLMDECKGRLRF